MHSKLWNGSEDYREQQEFFTEEQLQKLYPVLRRYCQFISQNSWDGEDLVQESLMKAWKHYRNHPTISTALLNKIAKNVWVDTVRKRSKESLEGIPDDGYDESRQIEERYEAVQQLMTKLTPKQAVIFVLKEGFQFQLSEIAEVLNTNETAVKAAVYRAQQKIEKKVQFPTIEQYWTDDDREQIQKVLHESLNTQDPSILIRTIPSIRSLSKHTNPTCSMQKSRLYKFPSSIVSMAA
ncbi:sigma-70 family RNA polymerase sigma factor [Bacillus timonensis]|uniref:sigma-70 family RNA polymerase sigma factor n=1 Tax=Bacillus timonensis TaxID=1033734 RepID=UPI0013870111|nr:sigma-70 family RNA polymerase sigma factor [Bacillus timonensis]